jgi:hypothetical protein
MAGRTKSPGTVSSQRQYLSRAAITPIEGFGAGLHNVLDEDHYTKPRLSVSELMSKIISNFRECNSQDYELHAVRTADGRHILHYIHKDLMASYRFNESVNAAWLVERSEIQAGAFATTHHTLAYWWENFPNTLAAPVYGVQGFNCRGEVKLGPAEAAGLEYAYSEHRLTAYLWVPA